VAADLWPINALSYGDSSDESREGDVEAQIASEMSALKRPKNSQRFGLFIAQRKIRIPDYKFLCSKLPDKYSLW
jgi:hypothetical protein